VIELIDHLFRREAGRMVATLTRIFGVHNLALAEDVVQDAFCRALEIWKFRGVPDDPSAWLMTAAKWVRHERASKHCRSFQLHFDPHHLYLNIGHLLPA
jgi:predicted RNA polymerase sigma factor